MRVTLPTFTAGNRKWLHDLAAGAWIAPEIDIVDGMDVFGAPRHPSGNVLIGSLRTDGPLRDDEIITIK